MNRPPFIVNAAELPEDDGTYPGSDERLSFCRSLGGAAGLSRLGVHLERIPPGRRTSFPHAHEDEEEFVYVLAGTPHLWADGVLHALSPGDFVAFPAGTGIAHTLLNDAEDEALVLVGGERSKKSSRLFYPLHPERRAELQPEKWWDDVPTREIGPHDGKPRRR